MYQREYDEGELIQQNIGLVHKLVNELCRNREMYDDLIQEGTLGLLMAIRRFDPDKGYAFSSFAYPYIRGYITRSLVIFDIDKPVRIPVYIYDSKKVEEHRMTTYSYNAVLKHDRRNDEFITKLQVMDKTREKEIELIDSRDLLKEFAKHLTLKEAFILEKLFLEGMTLRQTGKLIGVSYQRIDQLKRRAIEKIRKKYRCREALKRCLNT